MSEATEKQAMKTGEKVGVTFFHSTKSASCKGGFWQFSSEQARQPYVVRIRHLQSGLNPAVSQSLRETFGLTKLGLEVLLDISSSTLERRKKAGKPLDLTTSEKLDRIAEVSHLAHAVFDDRAKAVEWMKKSNASLGDEAPIMLCRTELGAKQVRRVLHAMDWSGAV